jgi:hypothetical protein
MHSFYAGMGGFAIDTSPTDGKEFIPGSPRLALTAKGILFLLSHGYALPRVSKASIKDRSKADGLAKILVCLQAGYIIVQYVGRLAAHLPQTFLEINTIGHVLCALIMYMFWWDKPQDIQEPTVLPCTGYEDVCAYMWMCSNLSLTYAGKPREISALSYYPLDATSSPSNEFHPDGSAQSDESDAEFEQYESLQTSRQGSELRSMVDSSNELGLTPVKVPLSLRRNPGSDWETAILRPLDTADDALVVLRENEVLPGMLIGPAPAQKSNWSKKLSKKEPAAGLGFEKKFIRRPVRIGLNLAGVRRWRLASDFIFKHDKVLWPEPKHERVDFRDKFGQSENFRAHFVMIEVPNWPNSSGLLVGNTELPYAIFAIATGLYGGLHGAAWYEHFPTASEQALWRTSSVVIACSGIIAGLLIVADRSPARLGWSHSMKGNSFLAYWINDSSDAWLNIIARSIGYAVVLSLSLPAVIVMLCYVPARIFLVCEAFASFRDLPDAVYQTPPWTDWITHL